MLCCDYYNYFSYREQKTQRSQRVDPGQGNRWALRVQLSQVREGLICYDKELKKTLQDKLKVIQTEETWHTLFFNLRAVKRTGGKRRVAPEQKVGTIVGSELWALSRSWIFSAIPMHPFPSLCVLDLLRATPATLSWELSQGYWSPWVWSCRVT